MRDELKTLIAAWHLAWFAKDAAAIAQMMAEDYVYVAPNGAILDRAAILQIVGDPHMDSRAAPTRRRLWSCSARMRHWYGIGGRAPGHFVGRCT